MEIRERTPCELDHERLNVSSKVALDTLFGIVRPTITGPTEEYWYSAQCENGMTKGVIRKMKDMEKNLALANQGVTANSVKISEAVERFTEVERKIKMPWTFYGTIVTATASIIVAVVTQVG